ncbi:MAG TPA: TonB-dependent receptor [Gemmatimonadales bacterium]|nr:TonB-dependent receptor [Gemmatimonadales bacterium]
MELRQGRCARAAAWIITALAVPWGGSDATLAAQQDGAPSRLIRGRVIGAADGTALEAAVVRALAPAGATVATGPDGGFRLRLGPGPATLAAASIGFAPETVTVAPGQDTVTIRLDVAPVALEEITLSAERAYSAASSRVVRALDLRLRPRESAQELLRLLPGLVIAQHAGGGKAEQIFLRGFDADHGTDVAISVDGTPVNIVSHAHGQGYADLHFLLPEVVDRVEFRKGPYDPQDGDLATAGAVAFHTRARLARSELELRGGSFGTAHLRVLAPFGGGVGRPGGYLGLAGHATDGPFDAPQGYRRLAGFGKWTTPLGPERELVVASSGFAARWNASGQVPERAVRAGTISRFGAIDPSEGGSTERYELSAALRSDPGAAQRWELRAYGVRYRFRLYSNFTFFLADTLDGDGIEQVDDRVLAGIQASRVTPGGLVGVRGWRAVGLGLRTDAADVELHRQVRRARRTPVALADLSQQHGFAWWREELELASTLRLMLGIRGDVFRFDVSDRMVRPGRSAERWYGRLSPRASVAQQLGASTTLFAAAGVGFHSNDARAAVRATGPSEALPRAVGAEVGARRSWRGGSLAAALWLLDLERELVYQGDEGGTEASGRTRRVGLDLEGRWRLAPWLWLDADLTLARGRFRDAPPGQHRIPLAPAITSAGGLTVRDLGRLTAGLRYRYVGTRPADERGEVRARGYFLAELFAGWGGERFGLVAAVDNLFNATWNEAQFATTSRLRGEGAPVTDLHFTPGAPRGVQVGVEYRP